MECNWGGVGHEIRRRREKTGVKVWVVGSPVPLCLFDKRNRWPLTVKSLPRCRRGKVCCDTAPEQEQVLKAKRKETQQKN